VIAANINTYRENLRQFKRSPLAKNNRCNLEIIKQNLAEEESLKRGKVGEKK
jgi:hypothetical protein